MTMDKKIDKGRQVQTTDASVGDPVGKLVRKCQRENGLRNQGGLESGL
jgi:hypothetical protein